MKDHSEIGHLTKYDAFRVNRDQAMFNLKLAPVPCWISEWPIECNKTKPQALWPISKDKDNTMNQSKLEDDKYSRRRVRENDYEWVTVGFGFTSYWMTKWHNFFKPIA